MARESFGGEIRLVRRRSGGGGLESVLGNYDEEWHTEMMPENINSRGQIRFWSKYGTPNGSETSSHSMS